MRASIRSIKGRYKRFTNIGKRCKMYATGCPICEEYRHLLETGRFCHSYDELSTFALAHDMEAPSITWDALKKDLNYAKLNNTN